jgi:hypothetical protein
MSMKPSDFEDLFFICEQNTVRKETLKNKNVLKRERSKEILKKNKLIKN